MPRVEIDWSVMRGTAGLFVASLVVSVCLIAGSDWFRSTMQRQFKMQHDRFMSVSRRYLSVDDEERIIRSRYPKFVDYYNRGIIGGEHRLNWVETLRAADHDLRLPSLRYSVSSRAEYKPDYAVDLGGFAIYASQMKLDMDMLHEGDFLVLARMLDERAHGLHTFTRCTFRRSSAQIEANARLGNVSSQCELRWLTLNLSGGEEISL
ncbi:MAG: hypothetical protein AB7Q97_18075 [Gammaproteobacteria bacterium]